MNISKTIEDILEVTLDRTNSIFQQKYMLERLLQAFADDVRQLIHEEYKQARTEQTNYEINNPRL